jgi:hypothetical protein
MWYSIPSGGHSFYANGDSILYIGSPLSTLIGTLNATTALQEAGVNLTAKYLQITTASSVFQSNLAFNSPMTKIGNTVSIDLSSYATNTALIAKENPLTFSPLLSRATNTISIDLSSYATTTALNAKENPLTFSSPLSRATNTVSINLSSYLTTAAAPSTYATTTALNDKENPLTFSSPLSSAANTISIDLSSYATTTALNAKENTLTFSSPLIRTTNTIGIDLSGYTTTTTNNSIYVRLSGATDMSGKLTVLNGAGLRTPQLGDYGGSGDSIILWKGGTGYPYSLGMNGGTMWYSVPVNAVHNFYVNGTSILTIASGDLVCTQPIGGTVINEAGQALSARYLGLGGGTLTGAFTGTT